MGRQLTVPPLAAARTARRLIATRAWVDNAQISVQIPRDAFTTGVTIVWRGTDNVTVAGAASTIRDYDPLPCILRIDVQLGNGGVKKSMTGTDAYIAAQQRRGLPPAIDPISVAELGAAAVANCGVVIPIDFALPDVVEREAGLVYPRGQEFLTVTVTTGNELSTILALGAGHVGALGGVLDFYRNEAHFASVPVKGLGIFNEFSGALPAVVAGYNNVLELPVGCWHRGLWIWTETGAVPQLAGGILNQLRVRRNNSEVLFEIRGEEIQSQMISEQGMALTAVQLIGQHYLDFCRRGKPTPSLGAGLDATMAHSIRVEMDCNAAATNQIRICTQYLEGGLA
jgi:hypothetical protein